MTVKKTVKNNRGRSLPKPGPGRPKGSVNKFTTLKRSFLNVYMRLGGEDELLEFAKSHKAMFYQMLTKLFPQEVEHSGEVGIGITAASIIEARKQATKEIDPK